MMIASEYELGIPTLLNQHGITEITVLVGTVSQILQVGSAESSKMKEANRYMVQKCVGCPTTTIYYSGTL